MSSPTLRLDRPHRFQVGDVVYPEIQSDLPEGDRDLMTIDDLTLRVRDGVAYPTYTLSTDTEVDDDVLCTADLVRA